MERQPVDQVQSKTTVYWGELFTGPQLMGAPPAIAQFNETR